MSAQTGLWLVVGVDRHGPWEWGFLTVRAGSYDDAARVAAGYTKRVSVLNGEVPLNQFPTEWEVTELFLPERCPQGIVGQEDSTTVCENIREGGHVTVRMLQGETRLVRL